MTKTPFAKSNPKTALMERLNLQGAHGERIYVLLYSEATAGRDRLSHDYNSLTKQRQRDGAQPPYKWDDLQETARHREILNIVGMASSSTRPYYQAGRWTAAVEENWVAEWFLWHSFRFRDNRNNQTTAQHPAGGHGPMSGGPGHGGASSGQYWGTVLH